MEILDGQAVFVSALGVVLIVDIGNSNDESLPGDMDDELVKVDRAVFPVPYLADELHVESLVPKL